MIQTKLSFAPLFPKAETKPTEIETKAETKSKKIISWNVNGLQSILRKDRSGLKHTKIYRYNVLQTMIQDQKPDILCLQEIRCSSSLDFSPLKYTYFNFSTDVKGYAGTMLSCNEKPLSVTYEMEGITEKQGRIITAEFSTYIVMNVYAPNTQKPERFEYRTTIWDPAFIKHVLKHQKTGKQIVIVGDLNCIDNLPLDCSDGLNCTMSGTSAIESKNFHLLLDSCKLVDSFRSLNPKELKYSWIPPHSLTCKDGARLDYCLVSHEMKMIKADILTHVTGSDHVPVFVELSL